MNERQTVDKSPFEIKKISMRPDSEIQLSEEDRNIVIEILKPLAGYNVKGALQILDSAKSVILECTQVHDKYNA